MIDIDALEALADAAFDALDESDAEYGAFVSAAHPGVVCELIAEIRRLRNVNIEQASQLINPDATCCADATRVHREQRLEIERLRDACTAFSAAKEEEGVQIEAEAPTKPSAQRLLASKPIKVKRPPDKTG